MRRYAALGLLAVGMLRCNGTETDNPATNPLVPFEGSACKKTPDDNGDVPILRDGGTIAQSRAALALLGDRGLMCWDWSFDEQGTLTVRILNLLEGCGIEWGGGRARVDGSEVFLEGINPACSTAKCGNCIYDVSFEVRGASRDGDVKLHFSVADEAQNNCNHGDAGVEIADRRFTIPAGANTGTRCRFLPNYAYQPPAMCTLHMECGDALPCTCPIGERCTPVGLQPIDGAFRCLTECATNADCPIPAAFECASGLCRLSE